VAAFERVEKIQSGGVAMVTKVQKMLNSLPNFFLNPPFFYFHGNCVKVCPTDSNFFAYLVPLEVDVTGNITAKWQF
jgi:hypothetical protein